MMNSLEDKPFAENQYFAIAFGGQQTQTHIGIFYAGSSASLKMLHLAFHNRLANDEPDAKRFCWAECNGLDEEERLQMAIFCESISRVNGNRIPYGITFDPDHYFETSGGFLPSKRSFGLTCATFVIAIFHHFAFKIIDLCSWQPRDDDQTWQESILNDLEQNKVKLEVDDDYIRRQRESIGLACRYKPEEVAACAILYTDQPISFQSACITGKAIKAEHFSKLAHN
jgi:hypothetical protein